MSFGTPLKPIIEDRTPLSIDISTFRFNHLYRGVYTHNNQSGTMTKQESSGAFSPDKYEWCGN